jgi:hypothetical protein
MVKIPLDIEKYDELDEIITILDKRIKEYKKN